MATKTKCHSGQTAYVCVIVSDDDLAWLRATVAEIAGERRLSSTEARNLLRSIAES